MEIWLFCSFHVFIWWMLQSIYCSTQIWCFCLSLFLTSLAKQPPASCTSNSICHVWLYFLRVAFLSDLFNVLINRWMETHLLMHTMKQSKHKRFTLNTSPVQLLNAGSRCKYKAGTLRLINPPRHDTTISSEKLPTSVWSGNDIHGQKMAAEAAAGFITVLREIVWAAGNEDECVGTDLSVLGRFASGSVWERERPIGLMQTEREREIAERKDSCCFVWASKGWVVW